MKGQNTRHHLLGGSAACSVSDSHAILQLYVKNFLTPGTARKLYKWCFESLPWYLVRYDIRQTSITTPRFECCSCIPCSAAAVALGVT